MIFWFLLGLSAYWVIAVIYHLFQVGEGKHSHTMDPLSHAIGALIDAALATALIWFAWGLPR